MPPVHWQKNDMHAIFINIIRDGANYILLLSTLNIKCMHTPPN